MKSKLSSLEQALADIEAQKQVLTSATARIRTARTREELVTCWRKYVTMGYVFNIWPVSEPAIKDAICSRASELGLLVGNDTLNAD